MAKNFLETRFPKSVLGVAAHADDLDFMASGTVATWAEQGAEIYYLILTNGNKGTADTHADQNELSELRRQEQRDAAKILGVKDVFFCDYEDGKLSADLDVKRDIVRYIRKLKPEAVITVDPTMLYVAERNFINHSDHRAAGLATIDAIYPMARDHLNLPELYNDEHLQPHKVKTVYLVHFGQESCFVDISKTLQKKIDAIAAHTSQVDDMQKISEDMTKNAKTLGNIIGTDYAEGFIKITID